MRVQKMVALAAMLLLVACLANADAASRKKKKHKKNTDTEQVAVSDTATIHLTRHQQRKLHRQERRRRKHEQKLIRHGRKPAPVAMVAEKKVLPVMYPPTKMKSRYRIDVLASMYLDELVGKNADTKERIPEKAIPGVSFYEGISIAADSLKKAGFNMDIYVHDVSSVAEAPGVLISKHMLDSSDLIIGAVPALDVPAFASYAAEKKINFVSTLSPSDGGIKNNRYFTLLQPSLKTHCEWISGDIAKKFPGMKITLLYRSGADLDASAYKYFTGNGDKIVFRQLKCDEMPGRQVLASVIDTNMVNVVVVAIFDPSAADSMLRSLSANFPAVHFEVYGMPSWSIIADLKKPVFPNLGITVTGPFNIDVSGPVAKYVMAAYKNDYGGRATEYVYRGFETMYWYANLLKQYGSIFNTRYTDNSAAPFTRFEVRQQRDDMGRLLFNENVRIFVTRYESGLSKIDAGESY